jgi:hypothetical protein
MCPEFEDSISAAVDEPKEDKKHPLFLPEGSVRAILSIIVVGTAIYSAFVAQMDSGARGMLAALAGSVITHYFQARQQQ